jgi:hypothetical protein
MPPHSHCQKTLSAYGSTPLKPKQGFLLMNKASTGPKGQIFSRRFTYGLNRLRKKVEQSTKTIPSAARAF